jgi:hypothetical protein
VELKQSTALSPFKPKDLVECYDMLKLHARFVITGDAYHCMPSASASYNLDSFDREIIQEDTVTLTMPLIGKGAKENHFQIGRSEVIVELIGFLHWIAENMSGTIASSRLRKGSHTNILFVSLESQNVRTWPPSTSCPRITSLRMHCSQRSTC